MISLGTSLFYFRIGVFSCFIWYLIEQDNKIINYFYYSLVISFSVLILDGYIQYFTNTNILGWKIRDFRISSFFGSELIMGSYLSRLFPLLFALFVLKKKNKLELYYMIPFFILLSGLIFISGERSAFFLYFLSFIFIIFFSKHFNKLKIVLFSGSLILILIFILNFSGVKHRMLSDPASSMKKSIFTPSHDSLFRTAYKMFEDKPVFGHGPKMFRVICKEDKYQIGIHPCDTHPHNFYLQLLAETGMIGFLFLFSVFCHVLYCAYRQLKTIFLKKKRFLSDYQVSLLAGILITVWPFTTNGNFFNNWLAIVYSLPVGFYLHSIYVRNK
jgi:O-antigen ligase